MASGPLAMASVTLTDTTGREATIDILEANATVIVYSMNGRTGKIRFIDLTEASRQAAIEYAKSKGVYSVFPPASVEVKVVNQRRNLEQSYYRKKSKLTSSFVMTGVNRGVPIPAAEATILIITQDTRKKYVDQEEVLTVQLKDTAQIPASETGDRREVFFKTTEFTFDTARDSSNVGGKEYKYFLFAVRDAETRQIVDFQTNHPSLEKRARENPDLREQLLKSAQGEKFSADI